MKPKVDEKRCFASKEVCKAIKNCPVEAISYIEVKDPIMDKNLSCNCEPPTTTSSSSCSCSCGGDCGTELTSCGGSPYGRIIIDYDKCTSCGVCTETCCGTAIEMVA